MTAATLDAPPLTRTGRRKALEAIAEQQVTGTPLAPWMARQCARALAHPSLPAHRAQDMWGDVLDEYERLEAAPYGTDYREMCAGDLACAIDDFINGTSTYRGTR
jgi:hypothetical protein